MADSKNSKKTNFTAQKCNSVYLCAKLYEYNDKDWQIEYYAQNPQTGKMKRFRVRVNKIVKRAKNKKEARLQIGKIIEAINVKLLKEMFYADFLWRLRIYVGEALSFNEWLS